MTTFQVFQGTCDGVDCTLAKYKLVKDCFAGQIHDSSPSDFVSEIGARVVCSPAVVGAYIELDENEELIWDDGSPTPEPCLDDVAPMVGKYEDLAMLSASLGFFTFVGYLAKWNDKASRIPWTPREYPYDNLRVELGGEP
ncbi:hypothetical protein R1flu_005533 [Riccia fluitans]|uniref:Uncharacterized protein n=1 Tax=Riccia fluitans TaxID=41844 RepID=A0ABD1YTF7_9MARC